MIFLLTALSLSLPQKEILAAGEWQNDLSCGVNALTWCARITGVSISRSQVEAIFPEPGPNGHSLNEIKLAAQSLLLYPEVHKVSLEELQELEPPFIIHVSMGRLSTGHYLVVSKITGQSDEASFDIIDGTSGEKEYYSNAGLSQIFTGYVVVINPTPLHGVIVLLWCAIIFAVLFIARQIYLLRHRPVI
ncbi:cysteine peptidase family C39 domain-containing protein [Gimesia fumaroli]|jgi:ABC-type bacteriocin/lantibiotic exporter with double-glycine peptidase domain|nr:cysteine peptidase family C39 domain-containing protein [Gimesia fumaroli]